MKNYFYKHYVFFIVLFAMFIMFKPLFSSIGELCLLAYFIIGLFIYLTEPLIREYKSKGKKDIDYLLLLYPLFIVFIMILFFTLG